MNNNSFKIHTDHRALKYLFDTKTTNNSKIERWTLEVQDYNMYVELIPGKKHVLADYLSRLDWEKPEEICVTAILKENDHKNSKEQSTDPKEE